MAADDGRVARLPAKRVRIAGAALPPDLAHLADGAFADALGKAVDYAHRALSPATEKIYADDWAAFRAWCQAASATARCSAA